MHDFIYFFDYPFLFSRLSRNSVVFFFLFCKSKLSRKLWLQCFTESRTILCLNHFFGNKLSKCAIACKNSKYYLAFRLNLKQGINTFNIFEVRFDSNKTLEFKIYSLNFRQTAQHLKYKVVYRTQTTQTRFLFYILPFFTLLSLPKCFSSLTKNLVCRI